MAGASKLHVLSLRDNELTEIPEDISSLSQLTVFDVCGNRFVHSNICSAIFNVLTICTG